MIGKIDYRIPSYEQEFITDNPSYLVRLKADLRNSLAQKIANSLPIIFVQGKNEMIIEAYFFTANGFDKFVEELKNHIDPNILHDILKKLEEDDRSELTQD